MQIKLENFKSNILTFMRSCGYAFIKRQGKEWVFERPFSGGAEYPKFHIYLTRERKTIFINLHLDQKAPTYLEGRSHSGEYSGETVKEEADRIFKLSYPQRINHSIL